LLSEHHPAALVIVVDATTGMTYGEWWQLGLVCGEWRQCRPGHRDPSSARRAASRRRV